MPASGTVPVAAMHRSCFPEDPWDASALDQILALAGAFARLAWQADDPVGFVLARDLGGEVEILSLGVLPQWRRRGIGRALLDDVVAETRRRDGSSVVLEVAAANTAAQRLYAGAGFVRVGRRPGYYRDGGSGADALILRRTVAGEPLGG